MLYQTIKEILILTNIIYLDHKIFFIELFHIGSGYGLGSRFESSNTGLKIGLPVTTAIIFIIIIIIVAVLVIAVLVKKKSKKENLKSG